MPPVSRQRTVCFIRFQKQIQIVDKPRLRLMCLYALLSVNITYYKNFYRFWLAIKIPRVKTGDFKFI